MNIKRDYLEGNGEGVRRCYSGDEGSQGERDGLDDEGGVCARERIIKPEVG